MNSFITNTVINSIEQKVEELETLIVSLNVLKKQLKESAEDE